MNFFKKHLFSKNFIFRHGIDYYKDKFTTLIDSPRQPESSVDIEAANETPIATIKEETRDAAKLLSIIIPAFNEGDDNNIGPNHVRYHQAHPNESPVKRFLEYILTLELPQGTEVIVVNNNSQDNTEECVERFYRENETTLRERNIDFRFVNASEQGVAHARNTGIFLSKGKYLLFLDADTEGFAIKKTERDRLSDEHREKTAEGDAEGAQRILDELHGKEKRFILDVLEELTERKAQCATMPLKLGSGAKQDSSAEAIVNKVKGWLAGTNYPFITGSGTLCVRDLAVQVGGFRTDTVAEDVLFGKDVKKEGGEIIVLETGQIVVDMRRETKNRYDGAELAEQKFYEYHQGEDLDPEEVALRLPKVRALGAEANVQFFNWSFLFQLALYFGGKERFVAMVGYEDMLEHMGSTDTYSTLDALAARALSVTKNTIFDAIIREEAVEWKLSSYV